MCRIFGRGDPDYTEETFQHVVTNLQPGAVYSFQMRIFDSLDTLIGVSKFYRLHTAPFAPMNVVLNHYKQESYNISWEEPAIPNGNLIGYRLCICPDTMLVSTCTCAAEEAQQLIPGLITDTWVITPASLSRRIPLLQYTVVVEVVTSLLDGTRRISRSTPVLINDILLQSRRSPESATSSSTRERDGLIVAIVSCVVVLLLLLIVVLIQKHHLRRYSFDETKVNESSIYSFATKLQDEEKISHGIEPKQLPLSNTFQNSKDQELDEYHHKGANQSDTYFPNDNIPTFLWDHFVKERAEQFLVRHSNLDSDSNPTTTVTNFSVPHSPINPLELQTQLGSTMQTAFVSQQQTHTAHVPGSLVFGMHAPRVLADGYGGIQVPVDELRSESHSIQRLPDAVEQESFRAQARARFEGKQTSSTRLDISDFEDCIKSMRQTGAIDVEFERLESESSQRSYPTLAAKETYNVHKNRYTNVLPIDDTRVQLQPSSLLGSDYINANFAPSLKRSNAFIVTQAPVPSTISDFWRMVWEQQSGVIAMIAREVENGKIKCHQYWPTSVTMEHNVGKSRNQGIVYAGKLAIEYVQEISTNDTDYFAKELRLRHLDSGETRVIQHWQFAIWSDHNVPESAASMIAYVLDVRRASQRQRKQGLSGPVIVHCSAGIGRSGVFVAVHNGMQQLELHRFLDIYSTVLCLRTYRSWSVQTIAQYRFIYDALFMYHRSLPLLEVNSITNSILSHDDTTTSIYQESFIPVEGGDINDMTDDPEYLIRALETI